MQIDWQDIVKRPVDGQTNPGVDEWLDLLKQAQDTYNDALQAIDLDRRLALLELADSLYQQADELASKFE
jgi:hypothetical protein